MEATATPPASTWGRLVLLAQDIKVSHSVFALPFALLATFLAAAADDGRLPRAGTLALIVVCMVAARTVAMTANRWADAALDALNPRTAGRAIPSGRLSQSFMAGVAACCAAVFVVAASGFWLLHDNAWPVLLSPLVLAWLVGYSFTKRFTWLCHVFLGTALALSPLAAVIATNPHYMTHAAPYLLALMVMCWVAGFDVIYALQDVDPDRATGLHSMPAAWGARAALGAGAALHAIGVAALIVLVRVDPALHTAFAAGVALVALLLVGEHLIVWRTNTRHIPLAFFTFNGVISLVLGGLGIVDVVNSVTR